MLTLSASFSKKVPVPGQEYSSQSFHAEIQCELPDGLNSQQLQDRIHSTFTLVRDSVENELQQNGNGKTNGQSNGSNGHVPVQVEVQKSNGNGNCNGHSVPFQTEKANGNGDKKAVPSDKQCRYILDLCRSLSINLSDYLAKYNARSLQEISKSECSKIISDLRSLGATA